MQQSTPPGTRVLTDMQMHQWADQIYASKEEAEHAGTKQATVQVQLDLLCTELHSIQAKLTEAQLTGIGHAHKFLDVCRFTDTTTITFTSLPGRPQQWQLCIMVSWNSQRYDLQNTTHSTSQARSQATVSVLPALGVDANAPCCPRVR